MEPMEPSREEMAPSAAPMVAGPWKKIAVVLVALLVVASGVAVYLAATRPAPTPLTVDCPIGYQFNSQTNACESTDTLPPTAVATASGDTVDVGEELTFDGSTSTDNVGVTTWTWNFGDGTYGTGAQTRKIYGFPGAYIVTVRVSDALGNADSNDENLIRVRVLHPTVAPSNSSAPAVILNVDNDVIRPGSAVSFDGSLSWIWRWFGSPPAIVQVCAECTQLPKNSTAMTFEYGFGDGTSAATANATHTFATAGTYGTRLVITGYNLVKTSVYRTIHVLPPAIPFSDVKNTNTIVRATFGDASNLDPARAYDSASGEVLDQVLEKLIFYDRDSLTAFKPVLATNVPSLADGTISADGREYRFHIRQGVTFHNGAAFTASDVEYSIERHIISDFTGGPMILLMEVAIGSGVGQFNVTNAAHRQRVQDFVRVEGNDVVFNLSFRFPPFLTLVSTWGSHIIDEETTIADGGWPQMYDQATLTTYNDVLSRGMNDWAIGTGPYVLDSWELGVQVVLKKYANYWNRAANPNAVGTVIIKQVVEVGTRLLMLQNGDADFGTILVDYKPQVVPLQQQGLVNIVEGIPTLSMVFSGINQAIDPSSPYGGVLKANGVLGEDGIPMNFFSDINVRRGLAYCMDYNTLITQTLRGNAQQARGPIPEGLQGFQPTSPVYTRDTTKAAQEFALAWGGQLPTTGFTFQFLYNTGNTIRQTAAQMMSDCVNFMDTNYHTSTLGVSFGAVYLPDLFTYKWTVGTVGWGADYPDAHNFVQPFMDGRAGAYASYLGYNNASVHALIDQGAVETDPAVRENIYRQLQAAAYYDVPGVFLYQAQTFEVYRSWIQGWYHNEILGESTYYFAYTKG